MDIKQLESALFNADKAGDADAAKMLAAEIVRMRQPKAPQQAPVSAGERVSAGVGGVNRGISGLAGLPVDTVENIINLGIAAFGKATGSTPDLMKGSVGGSQWIADRAQSAGVNTQNPRPDDTASRMLYTGGMVAGGSMVPGARPMPTAAAAGSAAVAGEVLGPEYAAVASMLPHAGAQAYAATRGKTLDARAAENATADRTATQARKDGYVIPPSQVNSTWYNRALEGFAGKLTTAQHASAKNQRITNVLARRSLGLADDAPLTENGLANIRNEAGKAYQAIKDFGGGNVKFKPDAQFKQDLDGIGGDFAKAAKEVPELVNNKGIETLRTALSKPISPAAAVEVVKKLRADAAVNFKGFDNPEKLALARAQKGAAEALEGLVERNLAAAGQGNLVREFRSARTTIARTYDIESALTDSNGNVSAKIIAKMADKGKPLGPDLQKVGDFANAFPKAVQSKENMGSLPGISPLDVFAGAAGYALDPTLAGVALARPAVRYSILSDPYQRNFANPNYAPALNPESPLPFLLRQGVLSNQ